MLIPTLLNNRYRVLRILGDGGFGETFLAEDTQMPSGRRCVIKQLKPVANNPQVYQLVQERFRREAAILEELGHSCHQIPTLYAYFVEVGEFYLVQEYIEGQTLTELVQQGLLSESSVKEILINILPVLDYVHSRGIVHRDIKPDNILIRSSDQKPVLIDFGAVKETMGTTITASGNSAQSIVIGTPGFMPMEQSIGRPVFASDIYSLGLTAIYLLTGKSPQEFSTNPATGDILWRNFALGITPTFAAILDKSIQSVARDRFLNVRDMLSALQASSAYATPNVPSHQQYQHVAPTVPSYPKVQVNRTQIVSPTNQKNIAAKYSLKQPNSSRIWQKVIMSGVVGLFISFGLWTTVNTRQSSLLQVVSTQQSTGWIRLGSVNNTEGLVNIGEPLIKSSQPVTIEPPLVPASNSEVVISNGVNLRKSKPEQPDFKLSEPIATLPVGQKVRILKLHYFVDKNSSSPYTAVWAEISLEGV